jgi:hypothetical protein
MPRDAREASINNQAGAVLHQPMADKAKLGFHARLLAVKPRIRIGCTLVRLVGTLLAFKVCRRVAPAAGCAAHIRRFLGPEALHRDPRLDQRAINREMLAGQQSLDPRLGQPALINLAAISPSNSRSRFFEKVE